MLVDNNGKQTITNDGATVMKVRRFQNSRIMGVLE